MSEMDDPRENYQWKIPQDYLDQSAELVRLREENKRLSALVKEGVLWLKRLHYGNEGTSNDYDDIEDWLKRAGEGE